MAEVNVTTAQNGRTVGVKVGDVIRLELPENATTGYRWDLDSVDRARLEVESGGSRDYGSRVGSGGIATWALRARAPGRTVLGLKQWRHWEGERSVLQRFAITLDIEPA